MFIIKRIFGLKFLEFIKSHLPNLRIIKRKRQNGLSICLGPDNVSYRMFFTSFKYNLINKFKNDLKDIDYFIDVGSNIGWYSLCATKASNCNVFSVEPNPNTFITLLTNIRINNLSQKITCINSAICSIKHSVSITNKSSVDQNFVEINNPMGISVISLKLDDLLSRVPKKKNIALKIDVEGLEEDVLLSGKRSLSEMKEIKLIYCEIIVSKIDAINKFLNDLGFICFDSIPNGKDCVNSKFIRK